MMNELFVHWNPDMVAFDLGVISIRWYSLCWVMALLSGYTVVQRLYRREGIAYEKFEPLFLYCFIGILAGARLGHCLLYEPSYFLYHPIEMLLPIRHAADGWHFTGYEGLASHGGTLGLMIALLLYNRKYNVGMWTILDCMGIAAPLAAFFIRIGNLMNSEIIGRVTDVPWAFVFEHVDQQPRHPGQLYEALTYLTIFIIGLLIYRYATNSHRAVGRGWFFGWCIMTIFTARILIEYTKEIQVSFEQGMLFNMGQLLSMPYVLLGAACMWYSAHRKQA